jgi:hypothetical protein
VSKFSIEFDRAIARARSAGNAKLADHLEKLRPSLNLADDDRGKVFAGAAAEFSYEFIAVAKELHADPFDTILMLAGLVANTLNLLQRDGLHFNTSMYALITQLEGMTKRIQEAVETGEIELHARG